MRKMRVTREQVIGFRLARHHLAERLGGDGAAQAAVVGLQDTPPGTAGLALAARADVAPDALDELILVPSIRGAPMAVAEPDLAVFTAGLAPPDEEAAKAVIGNAWKALDGITAMEALDRVSEAVHDSLSEGPLPRDDFHQALRERLPGELLWWCRGCQSHHVHPSLWRATGIRGVLAIVGPRGPQRGVRPAARGSRRSTTPGPSWPAGSCAPTARRSPSCSPTGPGWPPPTPTRCGSAPATWPRSTWTGRRAWALEEDLAALTDAPRPDGRAPAPEPRPAERRPRPRAAGARPRLRKRIWKSLGGPGTVLAAGRGGRAVAPGQEGQAAGGHGRGVHRPPRGRARGRGRAPSRRSAARSTAEVTLDAV